MKKLFRQYFAFAAGATPLVISFIGVLLMSLLMLAVVPVNGELLDIRLHYNLADLQAAMAQYGPRGRIAYALGSATVDALIPVFYITLLAGLI